MHLDNVVLLLMASDKVHGKKQDYRTARAISDTARRCVTAPKQYSHAAFQSLPPATHYCNCIGTGLSGDTNRDVTRHTKHAAVMNIGVCLVAEKCMEWL